MTIEQTIKKAGWFPESLPHAEIFLDPLFWQSLGKAMEWGEGDGSVPVWDWIGYWHHFIDHLAQGKDTESFFQELSQVEKSNETK